MQRIWMILTMVGLISCDATNDRKINSATGEVDLSKKRFSPAEIIADIDYRWSGCFDHGKNNLKLVYADGGVRAIFTSDASPQITVVDEFKMRSFYHFIKELKALDTTGFCTTTSSYTVKIGFEEIRKTDNACSWNGFNTLTRSLFR